MRLRPYLEGKLEEIQKHNDDIGEDLKELINGRRLTNIGTFRAYCLAYLRSHPKVHQNMTLLVPAHGPVTAASPSKSTSSPTTLLGQLRRHPRRYLRPSALDPPEFELGAYQSPSGADIQKAGGAMLPKSFEPLETQQMPTLHGVETS